MESVANKSEALSLLGERLSNACLFPENEVEEILLNGLMALDECEDIDGVYCYSAMQILDVVASAIWLKFYHCGHELQGKALMTHAIDNEG